MSDTLQVLALQVLALQVPPPMSDTLQFRPVRWRRTLRLRRHLQRSDLQRV